MFLGINKHDRVQQKQNRAAKAYCVTPIEVEQ